MKLINADKLIAEVERRKEKWLAESRLIRKGKDMAMYAAGKSSGYTEFLSLIDSLQQEQKPAEKPNLVAQLREHLANTPKEQLEKERKELEPWSNIGPTAKEFLYGKSTEWSEDLDAEVKRFFDECVVVHAAKIYGGDTEKVIAVSNYELTARHFAEWGAEHARKEK